MTRLVFALLFSFGFAVQALGQAPTSSGPTLAPVKIPNSFYYWKVSGFANMVGLLRLPSDNKKSESIHVWLKIPKNRKITVQWLDSAQRYTLVYPPGTIADRVDGDANYGDANFGIDDVRGARIDENGETIFHVYEKVPGKSPLWLHGYEWKRADEAADWIAGEALIKLYFPTGENKAKVEDFRVHNQCAACHQINSENPVAKGPPWFQTDSRGFFQESFVLAESIVVRDHRKWDLNADDPFVSVWCNGQRTFATTTPTKRFYACDQNPMGTYDIQSALKYHMPHAKLLCKSRAYLYAHMDAKAQSAFKDLMDECKAAH